MTIYIRNMVSAGCELKVMAAFRQLKIKVAGISSGKVETASPVKMGKFILLKNLLSQFGFEIIEDKKQVIAQRIRMLIIGLVHHQAETRLKLSEYIAHNLHYDYHYLSSLFSETEGITIEKFLIRQRVEKIKELLKGGELSITEIAGRLNYSSTAYLTIQFKKSTGFTPGEFRRKGNMNPRQLSGYLNIGEVCT